MIIAIWGSSYFGGGCSADEKKQNLSITQHFRKYIRMGVTMENDLEKDQSDLPGTFLEDIHPATQQGFMILCDASCTHQQAGLLEFPGLT